MIIYRETKQKIINIVTIVILVISVVISSVMVFKSINEVNMYKQSISELHEQHDKYSKQLEQLDEQSFGLISGEVVTAKGFGQNLSTDMESVADSYSLLYKDDLTKIQRDSLNQLFSDVSVKLDGVLITASAVDTLKTIAWTNNPEVDIRFESILNYDEADIPCLFTMWLADDFYGYVTCNYDIQNGIAKDVDVVLSEYGQKHEKDYEAIAEKAKQEKQEKQKAKDKNDKDNVESGEVDE